MSYVQVTDPSGLPLTLDEAKEHLKVPHNEEDALIDILIGASTEYAESVTRRTLMPRDFDLFMDCFPEGAWFEIPRPPIQSVASLKYYDTADVQQTFSASKYQVDVSSEPGRLTLVEGEIWPTVKTRKLNAVEVRYTAGYADEDDVPDGIKTAILLMVGHWFENREAVVVGPTGLRIKEVPLSAKLLLGQYRVLGVF